MFFLYFFRYLTFEEAIEALDCEDVEIPSDSEHENFREEDDEVDFVPEDDDDDDDNYDDYDYDYNNDNNDDNNDESDDDNNDDDECDDDTVDGEASCAEPTKKKRKKTERYLNFMHLILEAFHCLIVFFLYFSEFGIG